MTMGDRLRELRLSKNMSQEEVSRNIGITRSAYSHYEINNRQPVYETLMKLAAFFEVSLDYMIGGDQNQNDNLLSSETLDLIHKLNRMEPDKRKKSIDKMMDLLKQTESAG
ncbi:transcriptional regulator [Paenibacillus herberti]|uniref:Transcriptional regulator n=2 Tax=Paenibacillus herberti TaxID=1619309 RepID=A0A229P6P5_9BACL|nr:helix-turn-helix transcriptional regulator [Paenibacillus herberti]OXM17529.1 transcriptional regulator [Paenibacillus herberti]